MMKNTRRMVSFLLCLVLVFGLVGCGTKNDPTLTESATESSRPDHVQEESSEPVSAEESSEPVSTDESSEAVSAEESDLENHTHEYAAEITKEATCLESGMQTYTCACGDSYEEEIPALGHDYSLKSIDDKEHQTQCTHCGETKTEAHKITSKVKNASCTTDGSKTYTCVCGYSYTETIAAFGHAYKERVIPPTETEQGYTQHTCLRCNDSYRDQYTQPVPAEPSALEKKADSIIAEIITPGMSEYDKAKAIHDYICENVEYDYTYSKGGAANALLGGSVVCDGYASAFAYLCSRVGLNCYYESGNTDLGSHAWNIVQIDGEWYNVDCTWDDRGSYASYTHFLVPDEVFGERHDVSRRPSQHQCTSWKYFYVRLATDLENDLKRHLPDATLKYCVAVHSITELQEKLQDAYEHQYHIGIYFSIRETGITLDTFCEITFGKDSDQGGDSLNYPGMTALSYGNSQYVDCFYAHFGPNPYR